MPLRRPLLCFERFICSSPTVFRPGACSCASIRFTPGRVPTRIPARPRRRRTSWMSVHSVKLDTARSALGMNTLVRERSSLRSGPCLRRSSRSNTGTPAGKAPKNGSSRSR